MRGFARWALLLLLAACTEEARFTLRVEGASRAELDPLTDPRLTVLRILDDRTGHAIGEATVLPGQQRSVGALPPGELDLRIEGHSQSGLLLALGRARGTKLSTDGSHGISVALRKPAGMLLTSTGLDLVDTTASTDTGATIPVSGARAVAATHDGRTIVVAAESALARISTSTLAEDARGDLGGSASVVVVDPRDRTVAALLADRVVLVGIDAVGQPSGEIGPQVAIVAAPLAAAFSSDGETLFVVSGALPTCGGAGAAQSLVAIDRASGATATTVALEQPVADVAVHPGSGRLLLAAPCAGKVLALDPAGGSPTELFSAPGASDLAVVGDALVVVGDAALSGSAAITVGDLLAGSASQVSWEPPRFSGTFSDPRAQSRVDLLVAPTRFHARDVALSADGRRALIAASFDYEGMFPALAPGNGFTCQGILQATTDGVWGVDLSSGATWLERRAQESVRSCKLSCTLDVLPVPFDITCQGRGVAQPFQARGAHFLFGGT